MLSELHAVPVQPERGSALIFPHGPHPHSPLHVGSPVHRGTKYVLRTDVLYAIHPAAPPAQGSSASRL